MGCQFIFCLHNHQPVGNFDHIFEWAFKDCYNRTIKILKEYPEFRFAVHHSGPLLEWIKSNHPEYLTDIREMREKGQVEIIGGGFYEPIFSIISEDDIQGQIGLMQEFCEKEFGLRPEGFWTAERVWDPDIPSLVSGFDLKYTLLDDIHFRYAGIKAERLYGYFLTERLDKKICVFPIDKFLRYSIPFKLPEETISYFKERTEALGDAAFVYGDDGEKFGLWPETYQWVFKEKWLRKFVEAILNEDWIEMVHPSEYIKMRPARGRAYLTQGSYFELSEWALPAEAANRLVGLNNEIKEWGREEEFYSFLKGGVWNNFLNKYPESNAINKRTLLLSKEIAQVETESQDGLIEIKKELYKSECNCAYWHGLFGGIYLGNLRHALYEHLLKAESLLVENKNNDDIDIIQADFWNEGSEQILMRSKEQSLIIVPGHGGMISEIGIYNKSFNILNCVQRKYEAYHDLLHDIDDNIEDDGEAKSIHDRVIVKEKGLKNYLVFDSSRRYSFKEIILEEIPGPEDLMSGKADVLDCGLLEYNSHIGMEKGGVVINLSRVIDYKDSDISINKKFIISNNSAGLEASYSVSGLANLFLGIELNINLLGGHDDNRFYEIEGLGVDERYLDSIGSCSNISQFALVNKFDNFKIVITFSKGVTLLRYPVFTVSQSDSGFEKNFQGSSLLLIQKLAEGVNDFDIRIEIVKEV